MSHVFWNRVHNDPSRSLILAPIETRKRKYDLLLDLNSNQGHILLRFRDIRAFVREAAFSIPLSYSGQNFRLLQTGGLLAVAIPRNATQSAVLLRQVVRLSVRDVEEWIINYYQKVFCSSIIWRSPIHLCLVHTSSLQVGLWLKLIDLVQMSATRSRI